MSANKPRIQPIACPICGRTVDVVGVKISRPPSIERPGIEIMIQTAGHAGRGSGACSSSLELTRYHGMIWVDTSEPVAVESTPLKPRNCWGTVTRS